MRLYYSPGASSLAVHIALREADIPIQLTKVDLITKKTETGKDYLTINPKGAVPAIELDDGKLLTEVAVILQYIADQVPEKKLAPPNGTMERYRLMETLNMIATDIHKNMGPFFNPVMPDVAKAAFRANLVRYLTIIDKQLRAGDYLTGRYFTVADAYLFALSRYMRVVALDESQFPGIVTFRNRVANREMVKSAMEAEGL